MKIYPFDELISDADKTFLSNFSPIVKFERAIFFSWACKLDNCCTYCYMSTLPKEQRTKDKVRSFSSLLAETLLCQECGWDYGFLSGGVGVLDDNKLLDLIKKTTEIMGHKIWVNIGILSREQLKLFKPYIEGVVGTIEVLDPILHNKICPSKPIESVVKMFEIAKEEGIKRGMTLIVGLGETIDDFSLLEGFIKKHEISKIHIYGLNLQKGTVFENVEPPTAEYQATWIAMTRIAFPKLDIQSGIWKDRVDRVSLFFRAGANSVSKFPVLKEFGKPTSFEIEHQAILAGRKFQGTLTHLPNVNWNQRIDALPYEAQLKDDIKKKLLQYIAHWPR